MSLKIVSGGQTGVDRAALDVAIQLGMPHGGWCPKGRRAEDGPLMASYSLKETPSSDYTQRTEWNVRDSDATLILSPKPLTGGTRLTFELAQKLIRPCNAANPIEADAFSGVCSWFNEHSIQILNIAGPRESRYPGIYDVSKDFLLRLLLHLR